MGVLFVLILVALGALVLDHYSRLTKMGWVPNVKEMVGGRSALDPVGAALGELGRAELPFRMVAAPLDAVGKGSELAFKPIAAGLSVVAKGSELLFKPIGMVLGLAAGAKSS
ncbi:MAG TPA: hypothetical protein VE861_12210 [Gemmatimonadaceae bacterium]|nr:hypothetical protein [Gemmatimonadaceae bacterium]